jgi:signal transduction histidine kinase
MLAHELRNPLAPIQNAVQVLRQVGSAEPRARATTEMIARQSQCIRQLVEDLLDISRISRGKIRLVKQPIELAEVIRQAVETSRPFIESRKHNLMLSVPEEPIRLEGDFTRLTQVVVNLLNNAAKYTDEGGRIALTVEQRNDQAILCVRDSGIGITQDMLPRVFDLYAQSERALGRAQGGLGIGLKLVRTFVEMHGGSVQAFSEGPGRGSEFIVRLPVLDAVREWQPAATDAGTQRIVP